MIDSRIFDAGVFDNTTLDSVYEIEDVLLMLSDLDQQIEHLKGLKQHRVEAINAEMDKFEKRSDMLRKLVLNTMKVHEPKQKTLHFPSVGKVTRRTVKPAWVVIDETKAIDSLTKQGLKDEVIVQKESVDRKRLKQIIEELAEKNIDVEGTELKPESDSLSVSFEDTEPDLSKMTKKTTDKASPKIESVDYSEIEV